MKLWQRFECFFVTQHWLNKEKVTKNNFIFYFLKLSDLQISTKSGAGFACLHLFQTNPDTLCNILIFAPPGRINELQWKQQNSTARCSTERRFSRKEKCNCIFFRSIFIEFTAAFNPVRVRSHWNLDCLIFSAFTPLKFLSPPRRINTHNICIQIALLCAWRNQTVVMRLRRSDEDVSGKYNSLYTQLCPTFITIIY